MLFRFGWPWLCRIFFLCFLLSTRVQSAPDVCEATLFVQRPSLTFLSPTTAKVSCLVATPCEAELHYAQLPGATRYATSVTLKNTEPAHGAWTIIKRSANTRHQFLIKDLAIGEMAGYRLLLGPKGASWQGPVCVVDNALNYTLPGLDDPSPQNKTSSLSDFSLDIVLAQLQSRQGYCMVLQAPTAETLRALAAATQLSVIGVSDQPARVQTIRETLYQQKCYGKRLNVQAVSDLNKLPFPDAFANLVLLPWRTRQEEKAAQQQPLLKEALRLVRPSGGQCIIRVKKGGEAGLLAMLKNTAPPLGFSLAPPVKEKNGAYLQLCLARREVPAGGVWTHQYGDAANSANSGGTLSGATATGQMQVQWFGHPGGDFGLDRNPRMPSPLAVSGRLFHQGMNRMAALDAYNGTVLWTLEIPDLRRVNLPRDASNWCADRERLYVALKERLWVLDQQTGRVETTLALPVNQASYGYDWGYVAHHESMLFGSAVKKDAPYTDFWGKAAWFDGQSGRGTEKVVSHRLYGFHKKKHALAWQYQDGILINTTLAASQGRLFAVGSDAASLAEAAPARLPAGDLWRSLFLVCLDGMTGRKIWKQRIETVPGIVVYFLQLTGSQIIIASSHAGLYHLYAHDQATGAFLWHASHKWTGKDHSGHMQHPVVVGKTVYLEPCGYDLETGRLTTNRVGRHEGCTTYCATRDALIYRGEDRRVAMWDIQKEKVSSWFNLRPSCWLSTIPAGGMLLSPEGGGGCSCGRWFESSIGFIPAQFKP